MGYILQTLQQACVYLDELQAWYQCTKQWLCKCMDCCAEYMDCCPVRCAGVSTCCGWHMSTDLPSSLVSTAAAGGCVYRFLSGGGYARDPASNDRFQFTNYLSKARQRLRLRLHHGPSKGAPVRSQPRLHWLDNLISGTCLCKLMQNLFPLLINYVPNVLNNDTARLQAIAPYGFH